MGITLESIINTYSDCETNIINNIQTSNSPKVKIAPVKTPTNTGVKLSSAKSANASANNTNINPWANISDDDPRKKAWNNLPSELKDLIGPDEIMVAKDGSFIIKESFVELLKENGADTSTLDKFKNYDDWYIMALPGKDGKITYTLFKYREVTDDQDGKGTSLPFIAMDMDTFASYFGDGKNKSTVDELQKAIDKCVYSKKHITEYDQGMLDYFNDPKSDASYLMADFVSEKASEQLSFDSEHKCAVPYKYDDFDKYGQKALDELAEKNIYDKETNKIVINTSDGLSEDEKRALLLITTGDPDKYSFAAENQYHADKFNPDRAGKWSPTNESAIASDAGVGESTWGWTYEDKFRSKNGFYYKQQYEAHKGA